MNWLRKLLGKKMVVSKYCTREALKQGCLLRFDGQTLTVKEWAKHLNMRPDTLAKRLIQSGWTVKKALTTPVRERVKKKFFLSPEDDSE